VPPLTLESALPSTLTLPARLGILVALLWAVYRRRDLELTFVLGVLASLLTTPYVHIQDLSMLLPAGWILIRRGTLGIERSALLLSWLAIACASVLLPPLALAVEAGWFIWLAGMRPLVVSEGSGAPRVKPRLAPATLD
jgi:hypothetical protein